MQANQHGQSSYMQALDLWTETEIIEVLSHSMLAGSNDEAVAIASDQVKKAVRAKVLESYRNGQAAKTTQTSKRKSYGKR